MAFMVHDNPSCTDPMCSPNGTPSHWVRDRYGDLWADLPADDQAF